MGLRLKEKSYNKTFRKGRISEERLTYYRPSDDPQSIKWNELYEVGIVTTDEGPYNEDVYLLLLGITLKDGCVIPHGADAFDILLERLQKLENFNNEELVNALSCTRNNKFVLWKKSYLAQPGT